MPLGFPAVHAEVFTTRHGTQYLKEPGVVLISKPDVNLAGLQGFFEGFDSELGFSSYLDDPTELPSGEQLVKFSGQVCYMSMGEKRTKNADVDKYLDNIKSSGHGSVTEHANYTFFVYGIGRDVTHEAVRHRAGFAFSQVSQRYVNGKTLRFVERDLYQKDVSLHGMFEERIEEIEEEYNELARMLQETMTFPADMPTTDRRKAVNQAARSCLPNETEAPIVITANARAWRHFIEMRASEHADTAIRLAAFRIACILQNVAPNLFSDYDLNDEKSCVTSKYRKV